MRGLSKISFITMAILFPVLATAQETVSQLPADTVSPALDYRAIEFEVVRAINQPNVRVALTKASSELPGFLEMQIENGPLLLVNPKTKNIIEGTLFDYSSGSLVNVTEKANQALRRIELAKVSLQDMIVYPAGQDTKFHIYVFTDVDCGYCRKIHEEVPELNARGVEVRYLAFPRAGLQSATYNKMQSAWCAEDKLKALTQLKAGQDIALKTCDNPIAEQYQLGSIMGVRGTPAVITAEGQMLPGYMPADRLLMALEKSKATQ